MARPYGCFLHPAKSFEDRELSDSCPECGRRYDFPLTSFPTEIIGHRIIVALRRGYYGATYIGERGRLGRRYVMKVIPAAVYDFHGKDFAKECAAHAEVARGVDHVVPIVDFNDEVLRFGDVDIPCHVAAMEYVEGKTLAEFAESASAASLAQIAIDLFRLAQELDRKQQYHNDLHEENIIIERLPSDSRRADAVDETIRAVAIDLGSIADRSKSADRLSDWHSIAKHLFAFVDRLLAQPERAAETDYRLAAQLEEIGYMLRPDSLKQRTPDFGHFIELTRDAFAYVSSPWRAPGSLRRFSDAYNAQTLHWWFVPRLLVDPDGRWLASVSTPGPQLITGMRGCGKTLLLRALEFHARVSDAEETNPTADGIARHLENDRFLGLYVSCTRLLNKLGSPAAALHEPYARLYVAYAREVVRAARHLRELNRQLVVPGYHRVLAGAVAQVLRNRAFAAEAQTEADLERRLQRMLISLARGECEFALEVNPSIAFPILAEAVRLCSPLWRDAKVLFLLDDVSTRHLGMDSIGELLSSLLFQSDLCAFKLTTETQTLYEVLRSPGLIERARPGRDYEIFDLGGEVNGHLEPPGGKEFIARILERRANQYPRHLGYGPARLLSDSSLEQIAREIHGLGKSARHKKAVYRGISALTAVCVGDIGDVISIYDAMLLEATRQGSEEISPEVQSSCYQEYCSRRLYHLNRRDGRMKDFALSFAQAAHDLLKRSAANRLRQYTKIYVRLTTGDTAAQFEQIRELIDSGVFVFAGGTDAPRTKTRDSDPMQQFVLTYRKLFGLSSFIGLSDRDRFELSGSDLEEWLTYPENGRAILLRNLTGGLSDSAPVVDEISGEETKRKEIAEEHVEVQVGRTLPLFALDPTLMPTPDDRRAPAELAVAVPAIERVPRARSVRIEDIGRIGLEALVAGLGFEERTLESTKRILAHCTLQRATLIRYQERGHGEEIERLIRAAVADVEIVEYETILAGGLSLRPGRVLVDVTGLAKPALFHAVLQTLRRDRRVWVVHTVAERHYPLNEEIEAVLAAERDPDPYVRLEALDRVWSGEEGPYQFERLLHTDADESRRRLLLAPASPKHQRLLCLLDERQYDRIAILAPDAKTPRSELARLAADVACRGVEESEITEVDSNDIAGVLKVIAEHYQRWYVRGGYDFELGLTGSKLHAVAFASACAALKISQCWYVRPRAFDPKRFTRGVQETQYLAIEW